MLLERFQLRGPKRPGFIFPPPEAVALLDDVLRRLVFDVRARVVLIAGNHDGPERPSFGSRLLGRQKLYVLGNLAGMGAPLSFEDCDGATEVFPVPYADPVVAREWPSARPRPT
jgi:exonuclease SbcD